MGQKGVEVTVGLGEMGVNGAGQRVGQRGWVMCGAMCGAGGLMG